MSRVLDDIILEDVAKTCPEPFVGYHKCMESPEVRDKRKCAKYQVALQKCVREDVPSFQKIQRKCSKIIQSYSSCLQKNRDNYSSKCYTQLRDLRICAAKQVGGNTELELETKKDDKN